MSVRVVIPARLHSNRLPGKSLALVAGFPLVEHVRRAAMAADVGPVVVATDSERIAAAIEGFGGVVVRTGPAENGTLRVAQAMGEADRILNVQGDQPLLDPKHVRALASLDVEIGTVITPYTADPDDPAIVEALLQGDRAIDFIRQGPGVWRHLGLYSFTREALIRVTQLPVSARAQAVGLEQLTWLDGGMPIHVVRVDRAGPAVDTLAQLEQVRGSFTGG